MPAAAPKPRKKPATPKKPRAPYVALTGARPAKRADFEKAGLPYKRRYFVRDGQFLTRRQAEKPVIGTPEEFAKANRVRRGGIPADSRFYRYLASYEDAIGQKVGRSDKTFRKLYRESQLDGPDPEIARRRVRALATIFPDSAVYATYQEAYAHV